MRRFHLPKSIFMRFTLTFVLVGLLPLTLFTGFTISRFSRSTENNIVQSTQQMVALVANNLNARLEDIAHQTASMYLYDSASYGTLRSILAGGATADSATSYYGMRDFTKTMLDANVSLRNAIFWDSMHDGTYSASLPQTKQIDTSYAWEAVDYIQAAIQNPRQLIISNPHPEDYYFRGTTQVITLCRAYLDLDEMPMREKVLGVLMLDIPYAYLSEALAGYDWNAMGELHIVNSENTSFFSSNSEVIDRHAPLGIVQDVKTDGVTTINGQKVITSSIPIAGWQIQFAIDQGALTRQLSTLQGYTYSMILIAAVASLLLAVWASRSLSTPIRSLLKQMKRVQQGDLTAHVEKVGEGELWDVSNGFNHMVMELNTHVRQSYLAKIQQQEAELNELKTQIHPHFLYNTLEVIRMTALENGDRPAAEMTQSLAKQLKYVIGEVQDEVPLHREIEMTRDYINLIALRYGNIQIEVHIPTALMECLVLKLCLQPVVENAVQHGLRPRGGGWIQLSAQRQEDVLTIQVMDDGIGMSKEQLDRVQVLLQNESIGEKTADGWRGIGLKNVHDRIRFSYGEAYGLTVHSQKDVGSVIIIRVPLRGGEAVEAVARR